MNIVAINIRNLKKRPPLEAADKMQMIVAEVPTATYCCIALQL